MTQLVVEPTATSISRVRRLLAVYVDYLVFTAIFYPVAWMLESSGVPRATFLARLAIFAGLRVLVTQLLNATPGQWALGELSRGHGDPGVRQREAWWTVLAGLVLVLEGSKNLVRWTQGLPPPPVLGSDVPDGLAFAAISLIGAANITAGFLILRVRSAGALLGIAVLLSELVATVANAVAFRDWVAASVVARRALQGRPIRDGEVEFMQAVAANGLPLALVAGIVLLLAVYYRLAPGRPEGRPLDGAADQLRGNQE